LLKGFEESPLLNFLLKFDLSLPNSLLFSLGFSISPDNNFYFSIANVLLNLPFPILSFSPFFALGNYGF
jgi:hypothetical protein